MMNTAAAWREAYAALRDHAQRQDPEHALKRLVRATASLLGKPCELRSHSGSGSSGSNHDDTHPVCFSSQPPGHTPEPQQAEQAWTLPLWHSGQTLGQLTLYGIPEAERPGLVNSLQPLQDCAGVLLEALQATRTQAPTSLALIRRAMSEAGTFVWEWDIGSDALSDIDEGALMLGYALDDIGHTQADWNALIHPDDLAGIELAYEAHLRGEQPLYRALYRAKAADGQWRWLEERGRVVEWGADGQPRRMYGTQTDATAQHGLEQAQRDRLAAEAANNAKTRILTRVSHEMRTPLNAVLGFAQLMELDVSTPLPDNQRRRVRMIRQAGDYMLALIGDLLDVSLAEAGRLPLHMACVPLAPLLAETLDLLRPQADAAGIRLLGLPLPAGLSAQADPVRLKQVLVNLLGNSIKYHHRPGGQVQLAAQREGAEVVITVSDDGPGIPPERMAELFEPFNRLGREHGSVPGSGLGLALARMLVQAMGGQVSADCGFVAGGPTADAPGASTPPAPPVLPGCRFRVHLPV